MTPSSPRRQRPGAPGPVPLSPRAILRALRLLEPMRALASPVFDGLERIPDERPLLFVGNHTIFGILDTPFLVAELFKRKGILLRALGDHAHFKVPVWGELLAAFGVVDGTRENCQELMAARETILVFPGGGREVAKRKGEKYQLIWKERLGFARMALANRCTIVPFSAIGTEDAFDIVLDANDLLTSPLGPILRKLGLREDMIPPIAKGLGSTPLPRPERMYFRFAAPIRTAEHEGRHDDARCRELRDQVRAAVEHGIGELMKLREKDPGRKLGGRLLGGLGRRRR